MPPASLSGSPFRIARSSIVAAPMCHPCAAFDVEPREQRRIDGRTECAVALRQGVGEAACRVERDLAVKRVSAVHRLEFDQRGLPVGCARHRPHRGGDRDAAIVIEEFALGRACLARHQRERRVAAENDAALARQPVSEAARERADAGDRGDAERDAGNEHRKAAQAAAHLAQREAPGESRVGLRCAVSVLIRCVPSAAAPRGRNAARAPCRA